MPLKEYVGLEKEYVELDALVKNPFGKTLYVKSNNSVYVCAVGAKPSLSALVFYESKGEFRIGKFSEIASRAKLKLAASGGQITNNTPVLKIIGTITHQLLKL